MHALLLSFLVACSARGTQPAAPVEPGALTVEAPRELLGQDGLRLEEQRWRWGEHEGLAWRVSVPLPGAARVQSLGEVVPFERLIPAVGEPWAAINGGFYDPEGEAMGLVMSDGVERSPLASSGGSGIFVVGPDGPRVVHRDAWSAGPAQALQSIDRVVDQGQSLVSRKTGPLAARSAVVVGRERLWLVALADEESVQTDDGGARLRHTAGLGLPLGVFADYLVQQTDAVEALNLDGAVSTQMAVAARGKRWRLAGELGTINAVIVRPNPPASP